MNRWRTKALREIVDVFDHRRVPLSAAQRSRRRGQYPYYGAQGVIDFVDDYIFDGRFILIPEDGENLRSRKLPIAYFASGRFWVNNHAHVIKARPGVATDRFVQSALQGSDLAPFLTGAAQPKLSQANLLRIPVLLPSLAEQQVISAVLEAIDDLIENNRRRVEVLEQMARAIYREWFVHFRYPGHEDVPLVDSPLGPIPEGWRALPASSAMVINPRISADKAVSVPFLAMADLGTSGMVCVPSSKRQTNSGAKFQNGDTLVARITPCLENGKTGLVQSLADGQVGRGSTEFIVLRGRVVGSAFTYCFARSPEFREHAIASMSGADGRQRVRNESFDAISVAVPPAGVVSRFEETVAPMCRLVYSLDGSARVLASVRDLLLPKLVSGEIDVSSLDLDALVEQAVT